MNGEVLDDLFGEDDGVECGFDREGVSRPLASGVLSFHNGTEEAMFHYVKNKVPMGDYCGVLQAIDEFCYTQHWMMHIGDQKQHLLTKGLTLAGKCSVVVELGSYCGYSAVYIASQLSVGKGEHLFCIECEPKCLFWTQRLVDYAGLADKVTVIQSAASDCENWSKMLTNTNSDGGDNINFSIDVLFIDHDKAQYLPDLTAVVQAGLLRSGSVVVADNVLSFGAPLTEYLQYVRNPEGPFATSELFDGVVEYSEPVASDGTRIRNENENYVDGVEISVFR